MSEGWVPETDEGRSSAERYVKPANWKEAKMDGQTVQVWRARLASRIVRLYEVWDEDNKPHRAKTKGELSHIKPRQEGKFGPDKVKEVWAALFLDVDADRDVVWTISQWGVMSGLKEQIAEWGTPADGVIFDYDFVFVKGKAKGKTVYSVRVANASKGTARHPLKPEQVERINALYADGFDLNKLATGEDPFPPSGAGNAPSPAGDDEVPF